MRKITRQGLWMGLAAAATLVTYLAGTVRGQNAQPAPKVMPAIDANTLARATAKGLEMLSHPTWKKELKQSGTSVQIVGQALVCAGEGNYRDITTVMDAQTGRTLWEMNTRMSARVDTRLAARPNAPLFWTGEDLVQFVEAEAKLGLWLRSADRPEGKALWETKYALPPNQLRGHVLVPVADFADQQIIAGEEVDRVGQGGSVGGYVKPSAPLTIRAFDHKTGGLQWATEVPGEAVSATVAQVAEGRAYVLVSQTPTMVADSGAGGMAIKPANGFVIVLNTADGKVLWKTPSGVAPIHAAVQGSVLVVLAENGEVIAFDGQSGKEKWRTALSAECDPAKSKIGLVNNRDGQISLTKEGAFASVTKLGEIPANAFVGYDDAIMNSTEQGIALLDPQSGRQTGYFNAKGLTTARTKRGNPIHLQVHGDLLVGQIGTEGCMGINQTTLVLEWYIPARATASADGVLYVNAAVAQNSSSTEILAVSLDAPPQNTPEPAREPR